MHEWKEGQLLMMNGIYLSVHHLNLMLQTDKTDCHLSGHG